MKFQIFIMTLLGLFSSRLDAQTKVHYLISNNHLLVGDSAQITPIVINSKTNSKVELVISDFVNEVTKSKIEPFYFKSDFSGKFALIVNLKLSINNKTYFNDTQILTFNNFQLKANIYKVQNPFIAFVGVDNHFDLDVPGVCYNDVILSGEGLNIKKSSNANSFIMNCNKAGEGKIQISARKADGSIVAINRIPVTIKNAPRPTIVTEISKLDSTIRLNSVLNDQFILNFSSGVDSFTLIYEKSGKKIIKKFLGDKIDSETYLDIMLLPQDTWVYFENIDHWISFWGPKKYSSSNIAIKL